ncbi:hypothetical protein K435DRAFT_387941 [Dendrothele bispora CBS 962.96]|uniref:Uncharacterized protein n=1 Tax=Dendrothele bispora (strain CBS 962.96) TaxID=1314807 RepID=A0A4S8LAE9_DENBC|nr:hypothetical protein K435DRAFT_387941 [Dendrothele bispora CBS 962.96]
MRPVSDDKNIPARDSIVAPLLERKEGERANGYRNRCNHFFTALFSQLSEELPTFFQAGSANDPIEKRVRAGLDKWGRDMAPQAATSFRKQFFEKLRKDVSSKSAQPPLMPPTSSSSSSNAVTAVLEAPEGLLTALRGLVEVLKAYFHDFAPKLVICLDEFDLSSTQTDWNPFHVLCQVISSFSQFESEGVWVIFASTHGQMNKLAAPKRLHPSQRVYESHQKLFPPYTLFLWDPHAEAPQKMNVLETGSFEVAIKFGRPLWYSVRSLYGNPREMANFAKLKLTLKKHSQQLDQDDQALAVLGQRFLLPLIMNCNEAVDYVWDAVARHMRVLLSTSEDRERILSSYPSEPVLSHAAAELLHQSSSSLCDALYVLCGKIASGMFDKGQACELVSRLLLLLCRDFVVMESTTNDVLYKLRNPTRNRLLRDKLQNPLHDKQLQFPISGSHFSYLTPVPLLDVLCMLFGNEWMEKDVEGAKMKDKARLFQRAYISVSHWVPIAISIGSRTHTL